MTGLHLDFNLSVFHLPCITSPEFRGLRLYQAGHAPVNQHTSKHIVGCDFPILFPLSVLFNHFFTSEMYLNLLSADCSHVHFYKFVCLLKYPLSFL